MASFSHRLERKVEITILSSCSPTSPPPAPQLPRLGLLSVSPPASPRGEMGVGKQNAAGDLGLHVLPTSPWEFLKAPFNPAFPKGCLWVRNNDGDYRGKWAPPFPAQGSGALGPEFWPGLPSRPTGLFAGTPCSCPLAASASLSQPLPTHLRPSAHRAPWPPNVHPAGEAPKPPQVPDLPRPRLGNRMPPGIS